MEKSDEPSTENEIWGTCEELLLACAVDRHGTHSWDSIATEIRSRSPYAHRLTAVDCKNRFLLLKSRYVCGDGINGGDRSDDNPTVEIPWLDQLRKLRVEELRRELRRHDASIGSLELKVKRLKEERERSLVKSDVGDGVNETGSRFGSGSETDPKEKKDRIESPRRSPENMVGDRISGEDSGRSCKESNSTEPKGEDQKFREVRMKEEADRTVIGSRSGSVNESVAESKEEGTKESSDVQSSASLSRRRGRNTTVNSLAAFESQPLIDFLAMLRSNKDGSVFNRRLESQEGLRYRSLIRRHVDLEIVENRIRTNGYTTAECFRDLLLLCNNALVFYPKNSPESISAVHLRNLINKEMAAKLYKTLRPSPQSTKEPTPPLPLPLPPPSRPKLDPDRVNPEKPAALPPLVACRKRSFIGVKPAKLIKPAKKVEKEEKAEIEEDEIEMDEVVDKKSTKQRTVLSRKSRTGKGGGGGGTNVLKDPKPDLVEQDPKPSVKKRGAANFLNRIKLSPSSSNGKGNDSAKISSGLNKGGGEQQKKKQMAESKKQGAATVTAAAAAAAAAKRNVGRPPKRGTVPAKRKRGRR